jgi:hypothetical protein
VDAVSAIWFLNVKQGDSAVLELPGGYFGIIDFGDYAAGVDVVAKVVAARVRNGETFLFAAVTHFDNDHAGGLPPVLKVREPKYFVLPGIPLDMFEEWDRQLTGKDSVPSIDAVRAAHERVITRRPQTYAPLEFSEVPGIRFFALSPDHHFESELRTLLNSSGNSPLAIDQLRSLRNRGSLALYVDFDGADSMILLAEVEGSQYNDIWRVVLDDVRARYRPPVVVKLAHHGSRHNNTLEMFEYFGGTGVLMVSSAGGKHSHPDVTVMEQAQRIGAVPACTNLGTGCSMLLSLPARPPDIPLWRKANAKQLKVMPPSRPACYGTIRVSFDGPAHTTADFASVQSTCPFGGPNARTLTVRR